jgi:hypothetical protein
MSLLKRIVFGAVAGGSGRIAPEIERMIINEAERRR